MYCTVYSTAYVMRTTFDGSYSMSCEYLYCTMVYRGTIKDAGKKAQLVYKDDILRWSKKPELTCLQQLRSSFPTF